MIVTATKCALHPDIADAITDVELLTTAMDDTIGAMVRYAVTGRSTSDAITQLERLRAEFERARP